VGRGVKLLLLMGLLAGGLAGAVLGAVGDSPIVATMHDPTGDSGSGPDISALTVTVNPDQTVSFAVTLANRGTIAGDESVQFFLTTKSSNNSLNIAQFGDGSPPTLNVWNGSSYQTFHYVSGNWANSTFTTTIPLSDLQDALQAPIKPLFWVTADSYTGATPNATPVRADVVPDSGNLPVSLIPTATTTTIAPPPPPPAAHGPTGARPFWVEKIARLPHAKIEWTKLEFTHIPIGAHVSIACTNGCSLAESPRVVTGTAISKRFVRHPFSHGQVFRTKIVEASGAGWWTQTTIVAKPGGQEFATKDGCYLTNGASVPSAKC
jgi:hypothetical protein